MKLEDAYLNMEEEEQEQEYVHFSPMRFCRTDDGGDLDSSGMYDS